MCVYVSHFGLKVNSLIGGIRLQLGSKQDAVFALCCCCLLKIVGYFRKKREKCGKGSVFRGNVAQVA